MSNGQTTERRFYNNQVLCEAIGFVPADIQAFADKCGLTKRTVVKAMDGSPNVQFATLMVIVEGSGVEYAKVFDSEFYSQHRNAKQKR